MIKKQTHKLTIPIYNRPLKIIVTKKVMKVLKKYDNEEVDNSNYTTESTVFRGDCGGLILIIRPDAPINTICHESFHVTTMVLGDCGLELSDESDEAYAYLIDWVSENINNCLKTWK